MSAAEPPHSRTCSFMNLLRAGEEGGVARRGEGGESDTSRKARGGEIYVLPYGTRLMSVRNLVPILVRTRVS